jgi:preprotein translocase subunit SecD
MRIKIGEKSMGEYKNILGESDVLTFHNKESQEPRAKSQEPRAKSQEPRAKSQEPRAKRRVLTAFISIRNY